MSEKVKYNYEYEDSEKLKICFIGAGGHSFRNVYPTFQYAPVDLLAICDVNADQAAKFARQFGARRSYSNYIEMLGKEKPDAVFIVTGYNEDGRVQATDIALDVLEAGAHVWMEKPTAATVADVEKLIEVSQRTGRQVMTGLKKIFFPSIEKVKEIIESPEFGRTASIYIRYPLKTPKFEERGELPNMWDLVDHIPHPGAILDYLMGKIETFSYEWEPINGGSVVQMKFKSGAVGTFHMAAGISGSSPKERLEIVGEKANVVLENGVKLTYYRPGGMGAYGRSASYLVDTENAPLYWEPEYSLGNLYNKNIFYLGYVQEVNYFCECVLQGKRVEKGGLEQVLEITRWLEAFRTTPPGTVCRLND